MIDLTRSWPSIRHRSNTAQVPVDKGRATTLDIVPGQEKARRADTEREKPDKWIEALVQFIEGKSLSEILGFINQGGPAYGPLIGAFLESNEFLAFLQGFRDKVPLPDLGIRRNTSGGDLPPLPSICGVRKAVGRDPLRCASPDKLRAFFSDISILIGDEAASTRIKTISTGDLQGAQVAGARLGQLVNDVVQATSGGIRRAGRRMTRVGPAHYVAPGYEPIRVQKGRAHVIGVDVDGETVAIKDAVIDGRKFVRKRKRR